MGQNGAVHADDTEKIGVKNTLSLLKRPRLGEAKQRVPSVVNQYVDAVRLCYYCVNRTLDGSIIGDIEF